MTTNVLFAQTEGIGGLFRGAWPTLLREVPGNAVWFLAYETSLRALARRRARKENITLVEAEAALPNYEVVLCGGMAGVAYWVVPYPFDTAKSYIQTGNANIGVLGALRRARPGRHLQRRRPLCTPRISDQRRNFPCLPPIQQLARPVHVI